jgi:hypothetical protein
VAFERDLEILVIIWMDLCHVAVSIACEAFDQYRVDVGQQSIIGALRLGESQSVLF